MYQLTEEGRDYLKNGLPERRILEILKERKINITEIRAIPRAHIGVAWAKKNGWVQFEGEMISITESGLKALESKSALEEGLEEIDKIGSIDEGRLQVLTSRQLVEEKRGPVQHIAEIAQLTPDLIITGRWKMIPFRKYDVSTPAPVIYPGKKQAYKAFLDEVKEELVSMGFKEMEGPFVENSFFNCDALFMPQDHPARGIHDVYFVKGDRKSDLSRYSQFVSNVKKVQETGGNTGSTGWGVPFSEETSRTLMLRSHGTALSSRMLINKDLEVPGKYFGVARVFRPDVIDATHLIELNQLEGIVIDKGVNFRKLLGMLEMFAKKVANAKKIRFVPGYYPFTEPTIVGYIYSPGMKKWVEVLPGGVFRPEVTAPLGIKEPVIAWGIGIDRLFMIKEGINDIRDLFSSDIDWLRKRRV